MTDSIEKFKQFLYENNIPTDNPIEFGKLVKYSDAERKRTHPKKGPAHYYVAYLHDNGFLYAKCGSHSLSIHGLEYKSYEESNLTPDEIEEIRSKREIINRECLEEIERVKELAAKKCAKDWEQALPPPLDFEWLIKKNLKPDELRYKKDEDCLLVPAFDSARDLMSYQRIYQDGSKKNAKGASIKGCFCVIGDIEKAHTIYVAEGWSTAKTGSLVTGQASICAFGAGNIVCATNAFKLDYPNKNYVLLKDRNEAGDKAKEEWDVLIKGPVAEPSKEVDFNDVYTKHGFDEAKKQILGDDLPIISMTSFMKTERPPLEWHIDNFIMKNMIGIVCGPAGAGKTTFLLQLAYSLASGENFMDKPVNGKKKVLYVDAELGEQLLENTWSFILDANNTIDTPENIDVLCIDSIEGTISIQGTKDQLRFDRVFDKYDVIILDNYLKLTPSVDYDKQHHLWSSVFHWLRKWAKGKGKGKCILFGHHTDKAGTSMRGAGDMNNDLDFSLYLKRNPNEKEHLSIQVELGDKRRGIHPKYTHPFQCDLTANGWIKSNEVEPKQKQK